MPMTPALFAIFSGFIRERLGLSYGPDEAELLEGKLATRATEAGFASLLDYYYLLRYDDPEGAELAQLAETLVVGESYLFREAHQLQVAVRRFIAPHVASDGRARVWSAACAGGEEPYTLAAMLDAEGLLGSVDIVASDLSARALARAQRRVYPRRAVRTDPHTLPLGPHITVGEHEVRVAAALAAPIRWARLNLMDAAAVAALGTFQVIFCRNVLIYFDDATTREVVARLTAALEPGGALFVGVSESLLRLATALSCEEHDGVFVYRRSA